MRVIFEDKNLMMECIRIGWNKDKRVIYFSNGIPTDTIEISALDIQEGKVVIHKRGISSIPAKFQSVKEFFNAMDSELKDKGYVSIGRN